MDEERSRRLAEWIAAALGSFGAVERAIVFGSRARGDNRERSDMDIAIEAPGVSESEWAAIEETVDSAPTLLRLDVLRMDDASPELRAEIARDGQEIYRREPTAA